ncbi:MAG TPA: TraR/DksA C4-type zinc finger protein [Catenuloplanes sp.]
MLSTVCSSNELFRSILEERFQSHTNRLTELIVSGQLPRRGGYDRGTLDMLTAAARRDVADTALALRRMAEGTYGVCELCRHDIPVGRLRTVPHARFCVPCHRGQPASATM